MFGDSTQEVFSAVGILRAQVTSTSSEITTELVFVLRKARVAPVKEMMSTDSTIVLQWINSTNKHPILFANPVAENLEKTSVDQ